MSCLSRRLFFDPWSLPAEKTPFLTLVAVVGFLTQTGVVCVGLPLIRQFPSLRSAVPEWGIILAGELAGLYLTLTLTELTAGKKLTLKKVFGFRRPLAGDVKAIAAGVLINLGGTGVLTGLWQKILQRFQIPFLARQPLLEDLCRANWSGKAVIFIVVCLAVPLFEELLFRRVFFCGLLRLGSIPAAVISAIVFAAVHFFLLGMPGLIWMGLVFQFLALSRRTLLIPAMVHGLSNFSVLAANLLF